MSSPAPSQSNGYLWPLDARINKENLDNVTGDIHQRLSSLETSTTINSDALEDLATELVEGTYNNTVAPQLAATQQLLTSLSDNIEQAEDALLLLQQGGILAENVTLADIANLTAEDAQAAFAELTATLAQKADDTAMIAALASKLDKSGGTLSGGLTAPSIITNGQASIGGRLIVNDQDNIDGSFPIQIQNDAQASWFLRAKETSNNFALHLNGAGDLCELTPEGYLLKPNHPVFSADGAPVYSAGAVMVFGNPKINQGSNYNAATGVFTAPVTGKYYFEVYCLVNMSAGSGTYGTLNFAINGSSHNPVLHSSTSYTRAYEPLSFSDVVSLAEGDTLYANLGLYNGATSFGSPYNSFKGFLIG